MIRHIHSIRLTLRTIAAFCALSLALIPIQAVMAQDRKLDPEVEKVLRERVTVLQEAARLTHESHRRGTIAFTRVMAADQAVLDAELELAPSAAERVRIRESLLQNLQELEKTVEQLVQSGEAPQMDLLNARANRLRAQADLLLERKAAAR